MVRRLFIGFSLACGAAWLTKTALIAANGGTDTDGGVIGALWVLGMVSVLSAAASGTALVLRGRPWWVWGPASMAAVPLAFVVVSLVDAAAKAVYPVDEGWLRDELGLLVVAVALAAAATTELRRLPQVRAKA